MEVLPFFSNRVPMEHSHGNIFQRKVLIEVHQNFRLEFLHLQFCRTSFLVRICVSKIHSKTTMEEAILSEVPRIPRDFQCTGISLEGNFHSLGSPASQDRSKGLGISFEQNANRHFFSEIHRIPYGFSRDSTIKITQYFSSDCLQQRSRHN